MAAIAGGATLSDRTPRASSVEVALGSAAISPHIDTGARADCRHSSSISRNTPGSRGFARAATAELPRSTASAYCVRSFVPTLKKSTCGANSDALSATAGTSTMMPTSRLLQKTKCSPQLVDRGDHREHHPDRCVCGDFADRLQLVAEKFRSAQ